MGIAKLHFVTRMSTFALLAFTATGCGGDNEDPNPSPRCGDGVADAGEACDGNDLGGATCVAFGYDGGLLRCSPTCTIDSGACIRGQDSCGNGRLDAGEVCDGIVFDGRDCTDHGFAGGQLACSDACSLVFDACIPICVPDCAGGCCGSDGCGGDCADSCGGTTPVCDPDTCTCVGDMPRTCADLGASCGIWDDGHGGEIDCGPCAVDEVCAAGTCVCAPMSCAALGMGCGTWDDGCGSPVDCGTCATGQACAAGTCVCPPKSCADLSMSCGIWDDGCGNVIDCGSCATGQSCVGGACVCAPRTCAELGVSCGMWDDGCGGSMSCGGCTDGQSCIGGACVCVPDTCAELGLNCGDWDDGCGGQVACGLCAWPQACDATGACADVALPGADLSLLQHNGSEITLRWTYAWGIFGATTDRHELQESTAGPDSGFATIFTTPPGDYSDPVTHTVARAVGSYYYRVRTLHNGTWRDPSNVVNVTVSVGPPVLRVVNDLYDQTGGGGADWPLWNALARLYIAPDAGSLFACDDSCNRLGPGICSLPGEVIPPDLSGQSFADVDVSAFGGSYCVFLQCGWYEYVTIGGYQCWDRRLTQVAACDGVGLSYKAQAFCVHGHFGGLYEVGASEFLPLGNYFGSAFCP